ncbi:MAG: helix-turn-helix domain-containing protein [Acidobacteriota bacterium]|nr:helix-turn-helix domain-containing protein [Acidobacteriota bacterium]
MTQAKVAARLRVSQGYLSLLESGKRTVSVRLARRLGRVLHVPATALRPRDRRANDPADLAKELATLGYEPLAYLGRNVPANPAEVVLSALRRGDLESRLAEALPWVPLTYPDLNWDWLLERAKVHDVQNRLGYVVGLARSLAENQGAAAATKLRGVEARLEASRLAAEGTLCQDSMTQAERKWLRENRPEPAARWNLLTNLTASDLPYAA